MDAYCNIDLNIDYYIDLNIDYYIDINIDYYERSELPMVGDGKNSTQKYVRRRRTRCN